MSQLGVFLASTSLAVCLVVANILLRMIADNKSVSGLEMYLENPGKLLLALTLYFGVFLAYPMILKFYPMNIVFPVYTGLAVLLVTLAGACLFGENLHPIQYVGIALLVLSVACLTIPNG